MAKKFNTKDYKQTVLYPAAIKPLEDAKKPISKAFKVVNRFAKKRGL